MTKDKHQDSRDEITDETEQKDRRANTLRAMNEARGNNRKGK